MTTPRPTMVVWDLGGVFFDWSPHYLYDDLLGSPEATTTFLEETQLLKYNLGWDSGKPIAPDIERLKAAHPAYAAALDAWLGQWPIMLRATVQPTIDLLMRLKAANVPCFALTNWSSETLPYAKTMAPEIFAQFEHLLVSGDEGLIKPDVAIYERFCEQTGLPPSQLVFIDDNADNAQGARDAGWSAHHFAGGANYVERVAQLEQALAGMGILVAREGSAQAT